MLEEYKMERFLPVNRKPKKRTSEGYRMIRKDAEGHKYVLVNKEKQYLPERNEYIETLFGKRVLKSDEQGEYFIHQKARFDIERDMHGTVIGYHVDTL